MYNHSAKGEENDDEERERIEKMAAGYAASRKEKEKDTQKEDDEDVKCDTTDDETEDESSTDTDGDYFRPWAPSYQTFITALMMKKKLIEDAIDAQTTRWGIEEMLIDLMEDSIEDSV